MKMNRITIIETRNGVLVVEGEIDAPERPRELASRTWSFNSLDKAISQIRLILKEWKDKAATEAKEA